MVKILKKLIFAVVCVFVVLSLVATSVLCFADTKNGNITVELKCEDQNIEDGFSVYLSKIAFFEDGNYLPLKEFEKSSVSISEILQNPTENNAKQVEKFVSKNSFPHFEAASKNGKAVLNDIESGIWLVYCEQNGEYTFNPYFVILPYLNDGKEEYSIKTTPKISPNLTNTISVYVQKKWDDNNNKAKKRPEYVTVELKNNNQIIDTAMLSRENGWEYTFTGLQEGEYSVKEKKVKNYTANYEGDSKSGFVITNVYNDGKLPQTGQLWWPVAILTLAGIGFIILGIIELGVKKNAEKTK